MEDSIDKYNQKFSLLWLQEWMDPDIPTASSIAWLFSSVMARVKGHFSQSGDKMVAPGF